jgi:hypothetical protein
MSMEAPLPAGEGGPIKKQPALRLWFLAAVLGLAALYAWLLWPSNTGISAFDLSREDGKSRFEATSFSKLEAPPHLPPYQQLLWAWRQYLWRHRKRNPAAYTFPACPVQDLPIGVMLHQCMELTGTQYLIAVEIAGGVEFGNTNALNGTQWVAAFEHAVETSGPVICYDYVKKRNFQDTLLVIRERPGVVKIVPRTKLAEYQKTGLVKAGAR